MKRQVPLIITFTVGVVLIVAAFIPHDPFGGLGEDFSLYFDIIAVFAFFLGGGNLVRIHGTKFFRGAKMFVGGRVKEIKDDRRAKDWLFSLVTLVGFFVMLWAGLFKIGNPNGWEGNVTAPGSLVQDLFTHVFTPLKATMYALLAFFVASASYRAFRAKTREATVLLITAFIILLGRTPAGYYITAWLPDSLSFFHIPNLTNWIMAVPNLAGQRAIMIGISLGVVSMCLRVILGIERTYLGQDND